MERPAPIRSAWVTPGVGKTKRRAEGHRPLNCRPTALTAAYRPAALACHAMRPPPASADIAAYQARQTSSCRLDGRKGCRSRNRNAELGWPRIRELDINPLLVSPEGILALGARHERGSQMLHRLRSRDGARRRQNRSAIRKTRNPRRRPADERGFFKRRGTRHSGRRPLAGGWPGTEFVPRLIGFAREEKISRIVAHILGENQAMLQLAQRFHLSLAWIKIRPRALLYRSSSGNSNCSPGKHLPALFRNRPIFFRLQHQHTYLRSACRNLPITGRSRGPM